MTTTPPEVSPASGAAYELHVLDSGLTTIRSATVSPDGRLAITYGVDVLVHSLTIWEVASQSVVRRIETAEAPMTVRFTPDGRQIVAALLSSSSHTATMVRWDTDSSDDRGEVLSGLKDVAGVALSRDAGTAVFRTRSPGLIVLNIPAGTETRLGRSTGFDRVAVSPLGGIVAATGGGRIAAFASVPGAPAGSRADASAGRDYQPLPVTFSLDLGAVQSMDCSEDMIITASGRTISVLPLTRLGEDFIAPEDIRRLAVSSAGVLAAAHERGITVFDPVAKTVLSRLLTDSPVERLTFSLGGDLLVTAHADNSARVWHLPGFKLSTAEVAPETAEPDAIRYGEEPVGRDFYTLVDTAGYAAYADAIARAIQHPETQPPLTIGIKGTWGAGKTSLMRMVQDRLEYPDGRSPGEPQLRPVELTSRSITAVLTGAVAAVGQDRLSLVRNSTVLRRLKALHRLPRSEQPGISDSPRIEAEPQPATAATSPDADDSAWRPTVWFNPWMYQNGEQVWAGLAYEIIKQITERMNVAERENFWLRLNLGRVDERAVRRKVYGLIVDRLLPWAIAAAVCVATGLALLAVQVPRGLTTGLAGGAPALLGAVTAWQWMSVLRSRVSGSLAQLVQPMGAAHQFAGQALHGAADELVSSPDYLAKSGFFYFVQADVRRVLALVATPKRPLVVFVDDLDRCSPGTVVQVIEAINLFLAGEYPNSIFVIAMEPEMVAAHIEAAYSDLAAAMGDTGPGGLGWRFLEKIVQLPLALPAMEADRKASYLQSQFLDGPITRTSGQAGAGSASGPAGSAVEAGLAPAGTSAGSAPPAADQQVKAARLIVDRRLAGDSPDVRAAIEFAAPHLAANPREIKRFVNLFRFLVMIDSERGLQGLPCLQDLQATAKLAVLHLHWPERIMALGKQADGRTAYELIENARWEGTPGARADALTKSGLSPRAAGLLDSAELWALIESAPPIGAAIRHYL